MKVLVLLLVRQELDKIPRRKVEEYLYKMLASLPCLLDEELLCIQVKLPLAHIETLMTLMPSVMNILLEQYVQESSDE